MALLRKFGQSSGQYKSTLHERVLKDISNILNTRKGFGSFDPEFGIEDISHYTDQSMIVNFIKGEISRNLSTYYPQIEVVQISHLPSTSLSRIQILLEVRVNDTPLRIRVFNEQGLERWIVAQ